VIEPYLADDAFLADVDAARSEPGVHVWWLGQSGFLIQHGGAHLVVDPYLSDALTRKYAATETPHVRMTRRVVAPERLGFADVVLSTHGHGDHLDQETLRAIGAPVVAPARTVELARERSGGEVVGVSEGEAVTVGGFRIEAVPAVHYGGHCVGYVVTVGLQRLYHSGDTAWVDPGVRGVDLALVPINGKLNNLDGPEAARLAQLVGATLAVPCHYDMFEFNTATPDRFVAECDRLGQPYRVLRNGERVTLETPA
jgi:L-ascorbate metabolism protein UlaG (beta-lactamase superfamily)